MSARSNLIQITLTTLREAPEDWVFTQYEAKNEKLGITVWIANSLYGLKIQGPGIHTGYETAPFTGWLTPWRRSVMRAVNEAAGKVLLQRFSVEYPKQVAGILATASPD